MTATATRSRQDVAVERARMARQLREENPELTLEQIGERLGGVTKQAVAYLLRAQPQVRWPEEVVAAMCEALTAGKTPQDLLAIPGVAEHITVRSTEAATADQDRRRLSSLRKLICVGKDAPEGTIGRRLYDARQAGLDSAVRDWPDTVFAATCKALKTGAKYADVLSEVPQLAAYLGDGSARQATMLRVIVEGGAESPKKSRGRRLYDARQAGAATD